MLKTDYQIELVLLTFFSLTFLCNMWSKNVLERRYALECSDSSEVEVF